MDHLSRLKMIAEHNGGIINNKTAAEHGISRAILSKLCLDNKIQRIVRGQYVFCDDMQDELLSISMRSNLFVFSHETALFLHGISDRTPFEHTITAPSGKVPSRAIQEECKIYYIKPELFGLGKTMLTTPSRNKVAGYDLERTICDIVRSRSKVGRATFFAALRRYAASSKKDLNKLDAYAVEMKIAGVVRRYLEVLL
ncbi:MAG: hypothetical protein HFH40_04715 [Lachnospiraceae bacterium]|nr:hypothetical protein [Lachnospiraceae bacterium]